MKEEKETINLFGEVISSDIENKTPENSMWDRGQKTSQPVDEFRLSPVTVFPTCNVDTCADYADLLLEQMKDVIGECRKCRLCETRNNVVPGEGNEHARLMFIGEGPGADEDMTGRPFVGKAGQLLDKIILAMGMNREDVFIGNIVKCRPPQNRVPSPDEMSICLPYLLRQIDCIRPKVIVLLGATALHGLINPKASITKSRGIWTKIIIDNSYEIWTMPTFHPAALLRDPLKKRDVWEDMKMVMKKLEEGD